MPKITKHPGVSLTVIDGDHYARWRDPDTKRRVAINLTRLNISTQAAREFWAVKKSGTLRARMAEIAHGGAPDTATPLAKAVADYLDECRRERKSEHTLKSYAAALTRWQAWAADKLDACHELRPVHWERYREWLIRQPTRSGRPASPHSINGDLRECKVFAFWLRRKRLSPAERDLVSDALRPLKTDRIRREYLDPPTLRAILSTPGRPIDLAFVAVTLLTGCRLGEVLALKSESYRADQRELIVAAGSSKTRMERSIDLTVTPALEGLLAALVSRGRKLLFDLQTLARARDLYRRLWRLGSPRFTPQVLRQTCATYLTAMRGASWESQQLGHSVVIAERNYVGLIRRIDATAKTLEAAMGVEAEVAAIARRVSGLEK